MRKTVLLVTLFLVAGIVMSGSLNAEDLKFPRVSQGATVSQSIGLSKVVISYHRPGVKGRVIWGELVPYGQVWRAGANEATTIELSHDALVEGQKLPAGKYAFYAIPNKDEWTFIFGKKSETWGAYEYNESEDMLRVKVKPAEAANAEWMQFGFDQLTEDSAFVYLHWEKVLVGFSIKFDTAELVKKGIEKDTEGSYRNMYAAANYNVEHDQYEKALEFVNVSVTVKKSYWNMLLKAKIHKKLAKTKADEKMALAILTEANELIKDLPENYKQYATEGPKLFEEWSAKKK